MRVKAPDLKVLNSPPGLSKEMVSQIERELDLPYPPGMLSLGTLSYMECEINGKSMVYDRGSEDVMIGSQTC